MFIHVTDKLLEVKCLLLFTPFFSWELKMAFSSFAHDFIFHHSFSFFIFVLQTFADSNPRAQ